MLVAQLDPEPVCKCDDAAEADCGQCGYGPGWGEEEQVNDEEERGD